LNHGKEKGQKGLKPLPFDVLGKMAVGRPQGNVQLGGAKTVSVGENVLTKPGKIGLCREGCKKRGWPRSPTPVGEKKIPKWVHTKMQQKPSDNSSRHFESPLRGREDKRTVVDDIVKRFTKRIKETRNFSGGKQLVKKSKNRLL